MFTACSKKKRKSEPPPPIEEKVDIKEKKEALKEITRLQGV